ncbi:ABC transporter substrate-binding protein [bacterium]|nr:ABC transporter substrate-binding protein [bacterium]
MKKVIIFVMLISILLLGLTGIVSAQENIIKIGFFGALTGDQAVWGQADRDGLLLTVDMINEAGGILGKKIEVVSYDDRGDQLEAVNVVKRLIKEDKVSAIIGCNSSGRNIAVAPVVEEGKVPIISTFATNPRVTVPEEGKLMKYTFRVCFIDPYSGEVTAKFAMDDLGAKKAAILYEISSDYSVGVRDYFTQAWIKMGGEIVADEAFKTGDVDFRPQLTRIKNANPDVIIMPFLYKEVALSAKQARDLGITTTMLGGDGWPSSALLEMAGPAVEGSYFINHGDTNAPNVQDFRKAYNEKYNKDIEINSIMAHDAMIMLQAGIEKAGSADPLAIRDALENLQGVVVYTGTINVNPQTHNPSGKAASIIKIENNEFVFFKQFDPME